MTARRKDGGQPLRDAMSTAGLSLQQLARATRELDGQGVSYQLIAFLATDRAWGRDTCEDRSAGLIEKALAQPPGSLFAYI